MKILNKIDLHLHIDGSAKPETVYEIAHKYGIEPECNMTLEQIRDSMVIPDGQFDPDFLTFEPPLRAMQTAEGLSRITEELVEQLEKDGLIYAELRFAPQYHLQKGMSQEDAVLAVAVNLPGGAILLVHPHAHPGKLTHRRIRVGHLHHIAIAALDTGIVPRINHLATLPVEKTQRQVLVAHIRAGNGLGVLRGGNHTGLPLLHLHNVDILLLDAHVETLPGLALLVLEAATCHIGVESFVGFHFSSPFCA